MPEKSKEGFLAKHKQHLSIGAIGLVMLIVVVIVPVIIATTSKSSPKTDPTDPKPQKKPFDLDKISLEDRNRIDCFLEARSKFENLTQYQCEQVRGCVYKYSEYERVPDCYFKREVGYELESTFLSTDNREIHYLKMSNRAMPPFAGAIQNLVLDVEYLENNIIHIKIDDRNDPNRYKVPYKLKEFNRINDKKNSKARFEGSMVNGLFYFKIVRNSDNNTIFDTSMGPFIYEDQFIQLSTKLSSPYIYGFGENNHESLLHDLNFISWGMFARDNAPGWGDNRNLYGFQPVYYSIENSGKSHLVLLYNSNAMEYLFTPTPSLTLRTIGGILDFYFIVEDLPEPIFQTYHNLIGKPNFPPYWSFGFQICRWGYKKLDDVKEVVERTLTAKIPQDVQYIDIEYMIGYRSLTVDQVNFAGIRDYQKDLENRGIKLILILDPGIVMETNNTVYMTGKDMGDKGVYVKWPKFMAPYYRDHLNPDDMISRCWPDAKVAYPDYMYEMAEQWWTQEIREFMNSPNGTQIAGLWIDMNEPSSFETNELKPWNWLKPENDQDRYPFYTLKCPTNKYDDPPYRTKSSFDFDGDWLLNKKARLSMKTLCMIAMHRHQGKEYLHYDVHNLYAHSQSIATYKAMKNINPTKRVFTLTRSNFVGTGHYAAHWTGDNDSTWKHMKMSIIGLIEYNIFGITMVGSDICGFFINVRDVEMCTRWLQLGAFYTFSRNHNANGNEPKDPASFNDPTLEKSTRDVYRIRYTILPYIYTTMFHTNRFGGTASKALFFEFPTDSETYRIDEQFLLGSSLLISPVLQPGVRRVRAYIPDARWYDFRTGKESTNRKQWVDLEAPIDYIHVHMRGGSIMPIQEPGECLHTVCSRQRPLGLIIALNENQAAKGAFYWDDGETDINYDDANSNYYYAEFTFENNVLSMKIIHKYPDVSGAAMDDVWIYGLTGQVTQVHVNNSPLDATKYEFIAQDKVLKMKQLQLKIDDDKNFKIEIKFA